MPKFQNFNAEGEFMSNFFVQNEVEGLSFLDDPGVTRQEFKDECDVNVLMERYQKSGLLPPNLNSAPQRYLDLGDASHLDLMSALNTLNDAEASFMSLPAAVRANFENDPFEFIKFAENPENIDQLRSWGLVKPKELEPKPTKVEIVGSQALDPAVQAGSKAPAQGEPGKAS